MSVIPARVKKSYNLDHYDEPLDQTIQLLQQYILEPYLKASVHVEYQKTQIVTEKGLFGECGYTISTVEESSFYNMYNTRDVSNVFLCLQFCC